MSDWPDHMHPGVPLNPERDAPHWITQGRSLEIRWWNPDHECWLTAGRDVTPSLANHFWRYIAPCLTPDEVSKREDVKWHEGYAVGVRDVRRGTAFGEPDTHYAILETRIAELEAALGGLTAWVAEFTDHVGDCSHKNETCTCGRAFNLHKARAALEGEKGDLINKNERDQHQTK